MVKYMAVAVAVSVGGAVAVAVAVSVAGLTKRFFNHTQKNFLINVWGYLLFFGSVISELSCWRDDPSDEGRAGLLFHHGSQRS